MTGPRDKSLSPSSLIKKTRNHLRPRADFQDSIDEAHPVDIDYKANPWWRSRYSCWEVKGPVAEEYKEIGPRIHNELKQSCRESSWEVLVWPYMIGKSTKSAKPVIVIASEDETSREEARAAIERSSILMHHPYFKIWPLRHLPTGPVNPVAIEDQAAPHPLPLAPSFEVYFDPTERIRAIGMPIYIRHSATSIRRATANAVYNGIEYGYITAAHAFMKPFPDKTPSRESQDNFEFPFDSDSENESIDDTEVDVLSRYSGTSPEATESNYSTFTSSQTSGTRSQSPLRAYSTLPDAEEQLRSSIRSARGIEIPTNPDVYLDETAPVGALQLLGKVSATFTPDDCVVIMVTNLDVISFLQGIKNARGNINNTITASKARRTTVNAWTSRGPIQGNLLDLPLYMRLASSNSYQIVYKFTYDGDIKMGDCGTLVIDTKTRELYGHVIADSQNRRVAFMMAAEPVMNDIKENGNWQLITFPFTSEQEHVNRIGTHVQYDLDTASFPNQKGRERTLGQPPTTFPVLDRCSTPARDPSCQPSATVATDVAAALPDTTPGQIPSVPGSSVFPSPGFPLTFTPTRTTHLYANPQSTATAFSLGAAYNKIVSARQASPMTIAPTPAMLPPARLPGMGNPVSPSLGASARDLYTASTPGMHRHPHTLSPRHSEITRYSNLAEPPRSVLPISMPLAAPYLATNIIGSTGENGQPSDTPLFGAQENYCELTCEGNTVIPNIEAKIEKGFFWSSDRVWTCYRRNYFSVNVSYELNPWIQNAPLYVHQSHKNPPEQVQSIAVSLAAAVDGIEGKSIELIQHTPKRDKGPQLSMKKELLSPTPPGTNQNRSSYNLDGFSLPLQNDFDQFQPYSPSANSNSNCHHTFERIQFKSATANNGKRRSQQQYYHVILQLWANIQKPRDPEPRWVKLAAKASHPVVVRGRSPSHYQNEGPHNMNASRGSGSGSMSGLGHHGLGSVGGATMGGRSRTAGSHSVSSASSLGGGRIESRLGDRHMVGDEDTEMVEAA